ncbi:PREDICTED: protein BIG GRAIN 1-like B [Camelina sativa]|uniref:Protein BIG GRAIN 1-like B n=1 Tax=Camelina sativa TaxID=90675 RepID=A0ABM0VX25_CAMSA|nr:PREDICTED: protein BIG GRAIN 1-like B [Camelina sativa]
MDPWEPLAHHQHHRHLRNHRHPSFSSSLLDQIYRSIDDSSPNSSSSMRKTKHRNRDETTTARVSSSSNRRATSAADGFIRSRNLKKNLEQEPVFFKLSSATTSTSSDSSGGFSSFESDSFYRRSKSSPAIHSSSHHPKPIRTTVVVEPNSTKKQEHGGSFLKTKSKALRIYTDLKKVKQPISPGGRLATFLNSIFTGAGNTKKLNKINTTTVNSAAAASSATTTCSSASSFSRSCLSKTPSSSEKSKRSVRFCPVNVIFDEDSSNSNKYSNNNKREYDESTRHHPHRNFDTLEIRVMEENRRVIEAAKDLLRTYQNSNKDVVKISGHDEEEDEEDEDDDALSCTSSDLFELDNLSAIGIDRYREELPVYETTRLNTNRIVSR